VIDVALHYTITIQFDSREKVEAFRSGLGSVQNIVVLGIAPELFWTIGGVDALYLSLPRAERWGSRPQPPHVVEAIPTSKHDRESGFPPYILTGFVLADDEPNTPAFGFPLLADALTRAVADVNKRQSDAIRCVGFFEFELTFPGVSLIDLGRLFADAFGVGRGARG